MMMMIMMMMMMMMIVIYLQFDSKRSQVKTQLRNVTGGILTKCAHVTATYINQIPEKVKEENRRQRKREEEDLKVIEHVCSELQCAYA
jgi:hypothetical protein